MVGDAERGMGVTRALQKCWLSVPVGAAKLGVYFVLTSSKWLMPAMGNQLSCAVMVHNTSRAIAGGGGGSSEIVLGLKGG